MAKLPFNIEGYGKRFGAMPLPIEQSNSAADGELMVGRTTGHIYVRNGDKNLSKTVEIEEFLKAFRVGCINSIIHSGEFYPELAKDYWRLSSSLTSQAEEPTFIVDPETNKNLMQFTTPASGTPTWQYISNPIGTYNKLKYKAGQKVCFSITCKTDKPFTARIYFQTAGSKNAKLVFDTFNITSNMTKFELVLTVKTDTVFDNDTLLFFDVHSAQPNTVVTIMNNQLEPGDRSSAWRPSWLDFYDRLSNLDGALKKWVKEQITNAINTCNNYTDSSISNLSKNVEKWISNALTESKQYTDNTATTINKTIADNMGETIRRDMMQRVHINLGNQDFTKYLSPAQSGIIFDPNKRGIIVTGNRTFTLDLPIPIAEDSKYFVRVKGQQLVGDGLTYCGVDSLDANFQSLRTDQLSTYNYGVMSGSTIKEGEEFDRSGIFSGYNTAETGYGTKFDPGAEYFRFVFIGNYNGPVTFKVLIKSIEIFEIPQCLWTAITTATSASNGLMSADDKKKLDTVEWNANDYKHPTGDGNLHVPATGDTNNGKVLTAGSTPGSLSWKEPTHNADTLDGLDSTKFMRRLPAPSTFDCNDFKDSNAYFGYDSGFSYTESKVQVALKNTPFGEIVPGSAPARVLVIRNYAAWDDRICQECMCVYPMDKTTKYVRTFASSWGAWQKTYTTGDKPTPAEIDAVNKAGDTMYGDLGFRDDGEGIRFYGGAKVYKKAGMGLTFTNEAKDKSKITFEGGADSHTVLTVNEDELNAQGNLKGKNLDLGRFSIKFDPVEQCLDFIYE